MSDVKIVNALEQFKEYLNSDGVVEIVVRQKDKKIKAFQKIALNDLQQTEQKELLEKAIRGLNDNIAANAQNLNLLNGLLKVEKIGLLLNGANLCATCVGFAIINAKLDKMSREIEQQINQLQNTVKQGNDLQSCYEFNKVIGAHTDMLDCRKKQQPYSEEKMRELVDQEFNVLTLLIEVFQKNIGSDHEKLIFSMFSLLSMLTVSLRYFDEIYYENNHNVLKEEDIWHLSHDKWVSAYDTMTSNEFVEKLQDYAMLESTLTTFGADIYYISLRDQVMEQKQDVKDNQKLILAVGDMSVFNDFKTLTDEEIKNTIENSIRNSCGLDENTEMDSFLDNAFRQLGLA